MKLCLFLFFNVLFLHANTVIDEFHSLKNKDQEIQFLTKYQTADSPTVLAFVYAVEMKQASYKINPFTKLAIFNKTRKKLDNLIVLHPDNIALRYVRLLLQERIPSILGYNKDITNDKKIILEYLTKNTISSNFKTYIYSNTSL